MTEAFDAQDLRRRMLALRPGYRDQYVAQLADEDGLSLDYSWSVWGHAGQHAPAGDWRSWVIMAGRGFGKTRAGAEWLADEARRDGTLRIAIVAATLDEARRIMIEGESGLVNVAAGEIASWQASRRLLRFRSGAEATIFSGCSPEALRGPEHHLAWCDELAKWEHAEDSWQMLQLGLRLGERPRTLVTTTPRSGGVLKRIMNEPGCIVTRGPSHANPHVSAAWLETIGRLYAGTRLERQEIHGELLADDGALWSEAGLAGCRVEGAATALGTNGHKVGDQQFPFVPRDVEGPPAAFTRIVIGVDPPSGGGTCGIVVCARDADGIGHVLADRSVSNVSPERWAYAVAQAAASPVPFARTGKARRFDGWEGLTPTIVAERNQGGRMVEAVLRAADPRMRIKLVHASEGKAARAEPVALLFDQGRVRLHGHFAELEAQLAGLHAGGGYDGPGPSPDRADAMVWALTELMLRATPVPGVRSL